MDLYLSNTPRADPSLTRPPTISELAKRAHIPWDNECMGLKHYLKLAEKHRREGKQYARLGDAENAFVELAKAATLVLERVPEHPDYNTMLNPTQQHNLSMNGQEILDNLTELKSGIVDRYEKWRQAHQGGQGRGHVRVDSVSQEGSIWQREVEILKRQEHKMREHDKITRQQRYESENATRATRQNLAVPPHPPNNTSHQHAPSSSVSASTFHPPAVQHPTPVGPTAMPLESPYCEGDSTDSESLNDNFQRLGMDSNHHHTLKPVRGASHPPPPAVTTTSPIPVSGPIRYPALMTQHQKAQGYYPSFGSMFVDSASRQHGSSLPLAANSSDANLPNQEPPGQAHHHHSHPHPHPHQQLPITAVYMRPPPPPPATDASIPFAQSRPNTESNRIMQTSDPNLYPKRPLKRVGLPRECTSRFVAIATVNTEINRETCGLLLGKDKGQKYSVTTLLIPKQISTRDTCTMLEEELVLKFTEERNLITLGWIHTHPTQSCFMSSLDLHTHSGFQRMLPESFAVVCAPKSNPNIGIFRITDPPGLDVILTCQAKEAFHLHPDVAIYTDADKGHVQIKDMTLEIVDLR